MTRPGDIVATIVAIAFGAITGWLLAALPGLAVGVAIGLIFGLVASRANVRPAITMTVFVGTAAGALIGTSIVETLCLPDSCVALEATAGVVLAIASFVGVGIVTALVARSFDEYSEATQRGEPPPSAGCESEPAVTDDSDEFPSDQ